MLAVNSKSKGPMGILRRPGQSGFWFLVFGFWFLVSGLRFQVSCFRFWVVGFRFRVSCFEFQVSDFRFQRHWEELPQRMPGLQTAALTRPSLSLSFFLSISFSLFPHDEETERCEIHLSLCLPPSLRWQGCVTVAHRWRIRQFVRTRLAAAGLGVLGALFSRGRVLHDQSFRLPKQILICFDIQHARMHVLVQSRTC